VGRWPVVTLPFPGLTPTLWGAVEPNLQRHPYTTNRGDQPVGRPHTHGPWLGYLLLVLHSREAVEPNLQRHPYNLTSTAIPMPRPAVAGPTPFSIFFFKFFGPFWGAPGALAFYFRIHLLPLHVPIFFPTFKKNPTLKKYQGKGRKPKTGWVTYLHCHRVGRWCFKWHAVTSAGGVLFCPFLK